MTQGRKGRQGVLDFAGLKGHRASRVNGGLKELRGQQGAKGNKDRKDRQESKGRKEETGRWEETGNEDSQGQKVRKEETGNEDHQANLNCWRCRGLQAMAMSATS